MDDRSAHLPFIIGPRQCPGREVARIMLRSVVAKLIWLFDIQKISKELDFERDFKVYAMWSVPELRVRVAPVTRESDKLELGSASETFETVN